MKHCIIFSTKDTASLNIKEQLLKAYTTKKTAETFDREEIVQFVDYPDIKIITISSELISREHIDEEIKQQLKWQPDVLIFASKHRSASNTKSLTIHPIGNMTPTTMGGKPNFIAPSASLVMKKAYALLKKYGDEAKVAYDITVESTHHGPETKIPSMFIEIGSTEEEWQDKQAGQIIAKVIYETAAANIVPAKSVIVFGGGHYNHAANKILEKTSYAVGHIASKHSVEHISEDVIKQMIEKDMNHISFAVLDWKGLSKGKEKIVNILNKLNISYKKISEI